jgi:hypothetical protein
MKTVHKPSYFYALLLLAPLVTLMNAHSEESTNAGTPPTPEASKKAKLNRRLSTNTRFPVVIFSGAFQSKADCRALLSSNAETCHSKDCKAFINGDPSLCDSKDCTALLSGNIELCESNDCKAQVVGLADKCESEDCKAVITGVPSYCKSQGCKAMISGNLNQCDP